MKGMTMLNDRIDSEEKLAIRIVEWLQERGWKVYQEVPTGQGSPICDIIAIRKGTVWAIECKLRLGLNVVEQAYYWINDANCVSVGVCQTNRHKWGRNYLQHAMRNDGIGWIDVSEYGVREIMQPRITEMPKPRLCQFANAHHASGEYAKAGVKSGKRATAFRITADEITRYVNAHQGETMKSLLEAVPTHYGDRRTAASALSQWIALGKIPGIVRRKEGRYFRFYPKEKG